jgi:hypothetical protein
MNIKTPKIYEVGNPCPGMGKAHIYERVIPVIWILLFATLLKKIYIALLITRRVP